MTFSINVQVLTQQVRKTQTITITTHLRTGEGYVQQDNGILAMPLYVKKLAIQVSGRTIAHVG
jgi:hypothetical protein